MKKLFFSFVMLVTLVIVAGSAMAQSNYKSAFVGANHNYTIGGLNSSDGYEFIVTLAANNTLPLTPVAGTEFVITGATGTTPSSGAPLSVTANITWKTAGSYNVWVKVRNSTDGCYNYRYQPVNVVDYPVQFNALAIKAGDGLTLPADITGGGGSASKSDCPGFVSANFNGDNTNTPSNGSTYVYFKVTRSAGSATTSASNWTFTPSTTNTSATGWVYSYDAVDFTSSITMGSPFTVDNSGPKHDVIYIRATLANVVETTPNVTFNIGSGTTSTAFEVTGNIVDTVTGDDMSTLNLNLLPQVGGFTGN